MGTSVRLRTTATVLSVLIAVTALVSLPTAARAGPTTLPVTTAAQGSAWQWPLPGEPVVLRAFQRPPQRWNAGHRGIDLLAAADATVVAPRAGTVTFVGTVVDRGVLTITHPDGLRSSLEPLAPQVSVGDHVAAGQPVGQLSAGGHCGAGCLHWGIRRGQLYLDPMLVIGPRRFVVLKPTG